MEKDKLDIEDNGDYHIGRLGNHDICRFYYWQDEEGDYWLNSAETAQQYQKKGFGTQMIQFALATFGEVYFSKGSKYNHEPDPSDTRHLSQEGAALVNSCLIKGIIKGEWYYDPFEDSFDSYGE